jgi:hypothetical protein
MCIEVRLAPPEVRRRQACAPLGGRLLKSPDPSEWRSGYRIEDLRAMLRLLQRDPEIIIVRVKNRLDPDHDPVSSPSSPPLPKHPSPLHLDLAWPLTLPCVCSSILTLATCKHGLVVRFSPPALTLLSANTFLPSDASYVFPRVMWAAGLVGGVPGPHDKLADHEPRNDAAQRAASHS